MRDYTSSYFDLCCFFSGLTSVACRADISLSTSSFHKIGEQDRRLISLPGQVELASYTHALD